MPDFCLRFVLRGTAKFEIECSRHYILSFYSLWNNKLGEQTGIALVEALKTNTSLHDLE